MNGNALLKCTDSNFISCSQIRPDGLHGEDEEEPDDIDRSSESRMIGSCQGSEAPLPPPRPPEHPSRTLPQKSDMLTGPHLPPLLLIPPD